MEATCWTHKMNGLKLLSVLTAPRWAPAASTTRATHAAASLDIGARARSARLARSSGTGVRSSCRPKDMSRIRAQRRDSSARPRLKAPSPGASERRAWATAGACCTLAYLFACAAVLLTGTLVRLVASRAAEPAGPPRAEPRAASCRAFIVFFIFVGVTISAGSGCPRSLNGLWISSRYRYLLAEEGAGASEHRGSREVAGARVWHLQEELPPRARRRTWAPGPAAAAARRARRPSRAWGRCSPSAGRRGRGPRAASR
mmetsp:Transcript_1688/g.4436  ORF Transcript_1688/g.4436 Transcript_1688/m.4436 type:complete len:258 (+) Transcript_1688:134-907(+)